MIKYYIYAKKNVPAKKQAKKASARLSKAHENKGRKECLKKKEGQRKAPPYRLANIYFMLNKAHRLAKKQHIRFVLKKGRSIRNQDLRIVYIPTRLTQSRFAFVVSNKISKSSVQRNKLRRQMRSIIRGNLKKLLPSYDIIFIVSPSAIKKNFLELKSSIESICERARLFENGISQYGKK